MNYWSQIYQQKIETNIKSRIKLYTDQVLVC